MQINKITYSNIQTYPANQNAQGQNFQGARLNKIKEVLATPGQKKDYVQDFVENVGLLLRTQDSSLSKYATFYNKKRTAFFFNLAERLNTDIFYKKMPEPKNKIAVLDEIYNIIPDPKRVHFSIINNENYSFEEASQLLKLVNESKDKTELYSKLRNIKTIVQSKITLPAQSMIEILSSEHAAKLNKDIDTYSSYITLNYKKENFTQNLLAELAADKPSFDIEHLNKTVITKKAKANSVFLEKFTTDELLESYNPEGFTLLDNRNNFDGYLQKFKTVFSQEDKELLLGIIKTTTPENFKARQTLLKHLKSLDEKEDIARLIEKFDNDPYYGEIYENITKLRDYNKLTREPLDKIMYYIDSFGSKTVHKNFDRFAELTHENISGDIAPEETVKLISKNLNNPYYQSKRQYNNTLQAEEDLRHQYFGDTKARIAKVKRKIKFTLMPKIFGTGKPAPINPNATYRKAEQVNLNTVAAILERQNEAEPMFKLEAPKAQLLLPAKVKIKRDYKAQKLKIQQDAQEIIKSRMKSAKQIQEQIGDYSKKATKMRNQFLNEMFNSVAETRAQQRAQGIKRPKISNYDVLEVYSKINGKNKKLARTLLKARNEKGERIYDIKQIAEILEQDRLEQLKLKKQAAMQNK